MKIIPCSACKAVNDYEAETCARCGETLAMARLEAAMAGIRETTARLQHQQAVASRGGFSSINGFGTTLIDYTPRQDGSWEAVRWVTAAGIPLVPLGGYVIQPNRAEYTHGRRTTSFAVLDRFKPAPARIGRTYLLIVAGLLPLVLLWMNAGWLNHHLGGGKAFLLMLGTIAWAIYFVFVRLRNDGKVYKPLPPRALAG